MLIASARRLLGDSLARNSLLIMATTVINGGLGYCYWMLAARALEPAAIGRATALISAATAVSMVANLGIGHMFIQRLPGSGPAAWSRIVRAGLLAGCAATTAAAGAGAVLMPAVADNFGFLAGVSGAAALVCAATAGTASTLLDNVFVAHRASHVMLVRNLALAAGKIATLLLLITAGAEGAGAVIAAWTVPSILVSAGTVAAARGRLRHPGGFRLELPHIRAALTGHHLINLAQAGPSALLPVLVTARLGPSANASFYVAWMTASMLFMVSPAVASALYAERANAARVTLPRAAAVVLAVIGPPALLLFFGGEWILGRFSPQYAEQGALLLKLLVLAALPDAITNLAVAHWRSQGEFRRCRRLNVVMAAVCLWLTWLLLPGVGVTGAGLAWLAGQTAGTAIVAIRAVLPTLPIHRRREALSR